MAATDKELQQFLAKRGYDCEVTKEGNTFNIQVSCKSAKEVSDILASIAEPGRFIVTVKLSEVADIVAKDSGLLDRVAESKAEATKARQEANKATILATENGSKEHSDIARLEDSMRKLKADMLSYFNDLDGKIAKADKPWYKKW